MSFVLVWGGKTSFSRWCILILLNLPHVTEQFHFNICGELNNWLKREIHSELSVSWKLYSDFHSKKLEWKKGFGLSSQQGAPSFELAAFFGAGWGWLCSASIVAYSFLYLLRAGSADGALDSHSQAPHSGHNFLKNHLFFPLSLLGVTAQVCMFGLKKCSGNLEEEKLIVGY